VLFCLAGAAEIRVGAERLSLGPGDTFSVPAGAARSFSGQGVLIAVRGGDDLPAFAQA